MRMWNETTITWHMWGTDGGYGPDVANTNIRIATLMVCRKIVAKSLPGRTASFEISFVDDPAIPPITEGGRAILTGLLESVAYRGRLFPVRDLNFEQHSVTFKMPLRSRERFCERTFDFVIKLFEKLGIEDENGRIRGNFEITQATLIRQHGKWVPYTDWLRKRHGLAAPYIYAWTN